MTDGKNEYEMIAIGFVLRDFFQKRLFSENAAERIDRVFEVFKRFRMTGIALGFTHRGETMILDLADALAGHAIFLPDGIKRAPLAFAGKAKTIRKHLAGSIRKA